MQLCNFLGHNIICQYLLPGSFFSPNSYLQSWNGLGFPPKHHSSPTLLNFQVQTAFSRCCHLLIPKAFGKPGETGSTFSFSILKMLRAILFESSCFSRHDQSWLYFCTAIKVMTVVIIVSPKPIFGIKSNKCHKQHPLECVMPRHHFIISGNRGACSMFCFLSLSCITYL